MQVEMSPADSSDGRAGPAVWPIVVCVTVPANKEGLFILVQVGGWERGLLGPHLLCSAHGSASVPLQQRLESRKTGLTSWPL